MWSSFIKSVEHKKSINRVGTQLRSSLTDLKHLCLLINQERLDTCHVAYDVVETFIPRPRQDIQNIHG